MVRLIILVVIGLLSFSIVFGLGYFFIVPRTDTPIMESDPQQMGDMEPSADEETADPGEAPEGEMEDPGEAPESN